MSGNEAQNLSSSGLGEATNDRRASRYDLPLIAGVTREQAIVWTSVTRWMTDNPGRSARDACERLGLNLGEYLSANKKATYQGLKEKPEASRTKTSGGT